jgi:hypothetical protein
MTRLPALFIVPLLLLLACAAHEKAGDKAAALGDWKTAERQYAEAVRRDPSSAELRAKYQQARAEAVAGALRRARTCAAAIDWECAYVESTYALSLDDASPEIAAFQRDAAREVAHLRIRGAGEAAARGDHKTAFGLLAGARQASQDPAVAAGARALEPALVRGAVSEAERLRAGREYPAAIELLGLAAAVDGSVRPRLDAVRAEHEAFLDGEHARLVAEGDALVDERRFDDAQARYQEALRYRKDRRTEALARCAGQLRAGDAAVQGRDWARAEEAYGDAARLGVDRSGYAAAMLERVRVRPYLVQVRALRVRPTWRDLRRLFTGRQRHQPQLGLEIDLPDGRRLATGTRRALELALDARFVVLSNYYDDRTVTFRAVHDDGQRRHVIGVVTVPLAELVGRPEGSLGDEVITELRLRTDPTDLPDGAFLGAAPLLDETNLAPSWSAPAAGARGFRLASVEASAAAADVQEGPGEGAPDLYVEIEQRGAVVYRSPTAHDRGFAVWTPSAAYLFAGGLEDLVVRLWDEDPRGAAPILQVSIPSSALASGRVESATPAGSRVRLQLAPREAGPISSRP